MTIFSKLTFALGSGAACCANSDFCKTRGGFAEAYQLRLKMQEVATDEVTAENGLVSGEPPISVDDVPAVPPEDPELLRYYGRYHERDVNSAESCDTDGPCALDCVKSNEDVRCSREQVEGSQNAQPDGAEAADSTSDAKKTSPGRIESDDKKTSSPRTTSPSCDTKPPDRKKPKTPQGTASAPYRPPWR